MADPATLLVQNVAALYGSDPLGQKSADAWLRDWQNTDRVMPDSVEGLKKLVPEASNPAQQKLVETVSSVIGTFLRNRARKDSRVKDGLQILLEVAPHFSEFPAAMRCIGSCIAMGFFYKYESENPGGSKGGNSGSSLRKSPTAGGTINANGQNNNAPEPLPISSLIAELRDKGSLCSLYVLGALPRDVHECRIATVKQDLIQSLKKRASELIGTLDSMINSQKQNYDKKLTELNNIVKQADSALKGQGNNANNSIMTEIMNVINANLRELKQSMNIGDLLLECATPWIESCEAQVLAKTQITNLIQWSRNNRYFVENVRETLTITTTSSVNGIPTTVKSTELIPGDFPNCTPNSSKEKGANFMESLVTKTDKLPCDDPLFQPFVNELLKHVTISADSDDHDNFLKMRLLLTALDSWKRDLKQQQIQQGQIAGSAIILTVLDEIYKGMRSMKVAALSLEYFVALKRYTGGTIPSFAQIFERLRFFVKVTPIRIVSEDSAEELAKLQHRSRKSGSTNGGSGGPLASTTSGGSNASTLNNTKWPK